MLIACLKVTTSGDGNEFIYLFIYIREASLCNRHVERDMAQQITGFVYILGGWGVLVL